MFLAALMGLMQPILGNKEQEKRQGLDSQAAKRPRIEPAFY